MLIRPVRLSNCEINFQSVFVCLWVGLLLKMAVRGSWVARMVVLVGELGDFT